MSVRCGCCGDCERCENVGLLDEVERLRERISTAIRELQGTTAQGGDAEAILRAALVPAPDEERAHG